MKDEKLTQQRIEAIIILPSFLEWWDYPIRKMIGLLRLKPLRPNAKAAARRIFRGNDGLPRHGQQPHGRRNRRCRGRCWIGYKWLISDIFRKIQNFLSDFQIRLLLQNWACQHFVNENFNFEIARQPKFQKWSLGCLYLYDNIRININNDSKTSTPRSVIFSVKCL